MPISGEWQDMAQESCAGNLTRFRGGPSLADPSFGLVAGAIALDSLWAAEIKPNNVTDD